MPIHPFRYAARAVLVSLAFVAMPVCVAGSTSGSAWAQQATTFPLCGSGRRIDCVVDGDTMWMGGRKIRMVDYNTPETFRPACARERDLGKAATRRLIALLGSGEVTVRQIGSRDTDRFGRLLREVRVDGRSVGDTMVAEGLAEVWRGRRSSWCAG